jgi:hypothetical protein
VRLIAKTQRIDDLDRIFLSLRSRAFGRASIQEIGDFVAHREERQKGLVTQRAKDVFVSFENWLSVGDGQIPNLEKVREISSANFRIATDAQIMQRLGLSRNKANSALKEGLKKLAKGLSVTERERGAVDYFGGAFIWNPAFTDTELIDDLKFVLIKSQLLDSKAQHQFEDASSFIALYAISLMHGSAVVLSDGCRASLCAGYDNDEQYLEVKAYLTTEKYGKTITVPLCIFWTSLDADTHCAHFPENRRWAWENPLEINHNGLLSSEI